MACADGPLALTVFRDPSNYTDPHISTDWFDPGLGDLSGKMFKLKFMARTELVNAQIGRIAIQTMPENGDWNNGTSVYVQLPAPITVLPNVWTSFEYDLAFPVAAAGHSTSQMRIVLRPPYNDNAAVYDAIQLKNITLVDWVHMWYTPFQAGPTANYCGVTWTELTPVTYVGPPIYLGNPYYSANIDITGLPHGSKYYVVANIKDTNNVTCVSNPSGSCTTGLPTCGPGCKQVYTVCQPNCGSLSCSQDDGCGSVCPNIDGAVPATPTIISPTANEQVTPSVVGTYSISWSSADAKTDSYEYIIYPTVYTSPDMALASAQTGSPDFFYGSLAAKNGTFTDDALTPNSVIGANLRLAIRAWNTDCSFAFLGAATSSPWAVVDFTLIGNVRGEYMDDSVGGVCTSTTNAVLPNSGNIVQIRRNGTPVAQAITSGSTYSLTTLYNPTVDWNTTNGGALTAQLEIHNTDLTQAYICSSCSGLVQTGSCNADSSLCTCTRSGTIVTATSMFGPMTNFYLRKYNLANDAWWQTWGGLVLARGMMTSEGPTAPSIPDSCILNTQCDPAIVQTSSGPAGNPNPSFNETAGIPIVDGGNGMIGGNGTGGFYSNNPNNPRVTATTTSAGHSEAGVKVENYAYFANTTALSVPASSDGSTTQIAQLSELTATALSTGTGEVAYTVPGNLTINLDKDTKWSIPAGTKAVVFVPGDLTIVAADADPDTAAQMQQLINVDEGGFLAFIVKNDIIIDSSLGYNGTKATIASFQTPIIEGIFLASRFLVIETFDNASTTPADNKFVGAGSFIGLGGVDPQREFADSTTRRELNATAPTETFIFRPDFVVNTPNVLKKPVIQWREINN